MVSVLGALKKPILVLGVFIAYACLGIGLYFILLILLSVYILNIAVRTKLGFVFVNTRVEPICHLIPHSMSF